MHGCARAAYSCCCLAVFFSRRRRRAHHRGRRKKNAKIKKNSSKPKKKKKEKENSFSCFFLRRVAFPKSETARACERCVLLAALVHDVQQRVDTASRASLVFRVTLPGSCDDDNNNNNNNNKVIEFTYFATG